jgi:environmental stress-induced protein Ves
VEVIRVGDYRRMRWKNGLGETAEIAIAPPGAALDQFAWRVSMARVEAAGPFSAFPGIDRTLTVLAGDGFRLLVDGLAAVELTPGSAPYAFPGDRASAATLLGDAVTDLNVMTRRDDWWHRVRVLAPGERAPIEAATALVVCAAGSARVRAAGATAGLGALDTLLMAEPPAAIEFDATAPGRLLLVELGPR